MSRRKSLRINITIHRCSNSFQETACRRKAHGLTWTRLQYWRWAMNNHAQVMSLRLYQSSQHRASFFCLDLERSARVFFVCVFRCCNEKLSAVVRFRDNMRVATALVVVGHAFWCASAAASCQHFQRTKGCDPAGDREAHMACSSTIASGISGYCDCGPGAQTWNVTCEHRDFTCDDACALLASNGRAADTEFCAWQQTGGCSATGPREPASDKVCSSIHLSLRPVVRTLVLCLAVTYLHVRAIRLRV